MVRNFYPLAVLWFQCCLSGWVFGDGQKWWQNALFYEIYPQTFYDANGDGFGDLKGIEEKIEYLKEIGVDAVWLNPFYASPGIDNGYDISDYKAVDPRFGTMADFDSLIQTLQKNDIEFIMDFVVNHSSDQHEWFKQSIKRVDPYTDYYIWKDPKMWKAGKPVPPNNWRARLGPGGPGSAWQWNEERQQFYYHAFYKDQPDLDLRNPKVIAAMKDVIKFWIDKGVKGFRFDAVPWLVEDHLWRNEPPWNNEYTQNRPENYDVIKEFRAFLDEEDKKRSIDLFMTTEAYCTPEQTMRYYGDADKPGAHFPFNFLLLTSFDSESTAAALNDMIMNYLKPLTAFQFPNWVSGNHDLDRIPTRMGASTASEIVLTLSLLLPGTATIYAGDEIGMESDPNLSPKDCPPIVADDFRTPFRTPFQWSPAKNAGFTTANRPWIPVNPEHYRVNVETQTKSSGVTFLKNFKTLISLKREPAFMEGDLKTYVLDEFVLAFSRRHENSIYVVLINLSKTFSKPLDLSKEIPVISNAKITDVPLVSVNLAENCVERLACGTKLTTTGFTMPPKSVMVSSFSMT